MRTVLVTGGAGFVGSSLAIAVKNHRDVRVVALDNLKRRGSELNIPRLRKAGVEFSHGDIRDRADIENIGKVHLIIECSAEPSVLAGYTSSPHNAVQTNLCGMLNCLEIARRHEAGIVFLSTSRVYPMNAIDSLKYRQTPTRFELAAKQSVAGVSKKGVSESFPLTGTRSLYGATKLCGELMMNEYLDMYSLPGVINRCGVITGPWQMGKVDQGVVVLWVSRHIYGGKLNYIGYGGLGKQVRDMLHIDDLVRLVLHEMDHIEELSGRTFNVGGGVRVSASLCELTSACREATGKRIEIGRVLDDRSADIRWYVTDHTHVSKATGWRPEKDMQTIAADITNWIESDKEVLKPILTE